MSSEPAIVQAEEELREREARLDQSTKELEKHYISACTQIEELQSRESRAAISIKVAELQKTVKHSIEKLDQEA